MPAADPFYRRFFFRLFLGLILGVLTGLVLLAPQWFLEGIHPLDRALAIKVHCGIGAFAGFVIGLIWAFNDIWTPPPPPT